MDLDYGRNVCTLAVMECTVMRLHGVTVSYLQGLHTGWYWSSSLSLGFLHFNPLCPLWPNMKCFVSYVCLKQQSIYRLGLQRSHSSPRVWDSITQVPWTLAFVCSRCVTSYLLHHHVDQWVLPHLHVQSFYSNSLAVMIGWTIGHVVELGFEMPPHIQQSGSKTPNSNYTGGLSSMTNPKELPD